jgi:hypothetical protein
MFWIAVGVASAIGIAMALVAMVKAVRIVQDVGSDIDRQPPVTRGR